jgi:hypothetical protein
MRPGPIQPGRVISVLRSAEAFLQAGGKGWMGEVVCLALGPLDVIRLLRAVEVPCVAQ